MSFFSLAISLATHLYCQEKINVFDHPWAQTERCAKKQLSKWTGKGGGEEGRSGGGGGERGRRCGGGGVRRVLHTPYVELSLLSASLLSSGPDTIFRSPDLLITAVIWKQLQIRRVNSKLRVLLSSSLYVDCFWHSWNIPRRAWPEMPIFDTLKSLFSLNKYKISWWPNFFPQVTSWLPNFEYCLYMSFLLISAELFLIL